jgi:hypothetical protein
MPSRLGLRAVPSGTMTPRHRTRRSGLLLALACCLGLLAPTGAAARPMEAGAAVDPALAGAAAGPGQDLLRDPPAGHQLGAGSRRDERERRPGPALPGLLVAAPALASALVAGGRGGRPSRRRGPAAVPARAPPPLRPAPV